jgi:aromatic ring-opening dioxygenase catalytic subunit (LigB family)
MPAYFIPHGAGPCFFMDWTWGPADSWHGLGEWLKGFGSNQGVAPQAILVVSAHWLETTVTVSAHPRPPLIYDYGGFPEHTYRLTYPVPGATILAGRVRQVLSGRGIPCQLDQARGLDHGAFVPLMLMYPDADVPVCQLSLHAGLDPVDHLAIGRTLESLREEGVLIIGSGSSYHNLHQPPEAATVISEAFDAWLSEILCARPACERESSLADWVSAPRASDAHPTAEHLLPLMVVAGAAPLETAEKVYSDVVLGARLSAFRFGRIPSAGN